MEDYGFTPVSSASPRPRGSRWVLVGGVALALALTLGVGALVGAVWSGGHAQAASNPSSASSASQVQTTNFAPGNADNPGRGFAGTPGPGGQGQCVTLTVSSISGSTIVAKAADGSTVTIHTTASTKYTKNHQTAAASDVKVGSRISVMGTKNSDGSITATSIDILG